MNAGSYNKAVRFGRSETALAVPNAPLPGACISGQSDLTRAVARALTEPLPQGRASRRARTCEHSFALI
jgi:hypothetical protein